jgi:hypothetical protein
LNKGFVTGIAYPAVVAIPAVITTRFGRYVTDQTVIVLVWAMGLFIPLTVPRFFEIILEKQTLNTRTIYNDPFSQLFMAPCCIFCLDTDHAVSHQHEERRGQVGSK